MDFSFSAEQHELRSAVRSLAADRATPAEVRRAMTSPSGVDEALWRLVGADMGLTGVGVSAEVCGAGGGFVDAAVVIEEAGCWLLPVPLVSTLAAGQVLSRCGASGAQFLGAVAAGEEVATIGVSEQPIGGGRLGFGSGAGAATGVVRHVLDGPVASVFVVAAPDGLWALRRDDRGVTVEPATALDPTRRQATVSLDGAAALGLGDAAAAETAVDVLRVALAVEAVGCARRCLEMTVDYLKTREQFGRPIGSFQALHHRAAELVVELESAASTTYYAAWAAAEAPDELPVVAPLAKAVSCEAAWHIAAETIQLHGGIGFTWEHDAHLYFKRVTTSRVLLGDAAAQRRLVADRGGLRG